MKENVSGCFFLNTVYISLGHNHFKIRYTARLCQLLWIASDACVMRFSKVDTLLILF